jgi:hypothetical protein
MEITVTDKFGNVLISEKEPPKGYTIQYKKVDAGVGMPGTNE